MSLVPTTPVSLTGQDAILQGATYYREFHLKDEGGDPLDLSAWTGASKGARCQFRDSNNGATVAVNPTVAIMSPAADGKISITIDSVTTAALGAIEGGVFDLELFNNTVSPPLVERVVRGTWALDREVTR